jgi:transcriptional antiterminator RfaH
MSEAGAPVGAFVPCGCRGEPAFQWLCVNTEFGRETLADQELRTLGLCTWLPSHLLRDRIRPLFPRYLFVQADRGAELWRRIYRTRGVVTILGSGRPASVPASVLEILWQQCAPNGVIYPPKPVPVDHTTPIPCGSSVLLASGAMIGLTGICQWSDGKRVRLLLEILGRGVAVTVPRASVEAVK